MDIKRFASFWGNSLSYNTAQTYHNIICMQQLNVNIFILPAHTNYIITLHIEN